MFNLRDGTVLDVGVEVYRVRNGAIEDFIVEDVVNTESGKLCFVSRKVVRQIDDFYGRPESAVANELQRITNGIKDAMKVRAEWADLQAVTMNSIAAFEAMKFEEQRAKEVPF